MKSEEEIWQRAERIAAHLDELEDVISIYYEPTIDGVIASAILMRAFYDLDIPCVATNAQNIRESPSFIFLGKSIDEGLESLISKETILLTENALPHEENDLFLNTKMMPNGAQLLSTLAYLIGESLLPDPSPLIPLVILSACVDHSGDATEVITNEFFRELISLGEKHGVLSISKSFIFLGQSIFRLPDLLRYSLNPPLKGLTGNPESVGKLLYKLNISPEAFVSDLSEELMTQLNSQLVISQSPFAKAYNLPPHFMEETIEFCNEDLSSPLRNVRNYSHILRELYYENKVEQILPVLIGERDDEFKRVKEFYVRSITRPFDIVETIIEKMDVSTEDMVTLIQTDHSISREHVGDVLLTIKLRDGIPKTGITVLAPTSSTSIALTFGEENEELSSEHVLSIAVEKGLSVQQRQNGTMIIDTTDATEFVIALREFVRLNFL